MDATFTAYQWLQLLSLGGVAGMLGQGARSVVGFKKLHDAASVTGGGISELVQVNRLFIAFATGFVAGALAAVTTISTIEALRAISLQQVLAMAAAGYMGGDFIEGLITRVAPAPNLAPGQEGVGSGGVGAVSNDGTVG